MEDGADQPLRLAQGEAKHGPQGQRRQDRQRGVPGLPAPGGARRRPPPLDGFGAEPYRQAPTLAQAGVILAPVRYLVLLLRNVVPAVLVQLEWQGGHPGIRDGAILLRRAGSGHHWADPCNNAPRDGRLGIPPRAAARVTPGRRSSRWIAAQSGSVLCRLPGCDPPTGANSNASRPPSVNVGGSGQTSPAAMNRARQSCTVLRATPTATAIARREAPHSCFSRRISRTRRIDTLSAGIGPPSRPDETADRSPAQRSGNTTPPRGGRLQIGLADFSPESPADITSESQADLARNTQGGHPPPRSEHGGRIEKRGKAGKL